MDFVKFLLLVLSLALFQTNAQAGILKDIGNDFASPVTTKAKYAFWSGAGLTVALVLLKKDISFPLQEDVARDRPLGKSTKYGDYYGQVYPNIAYAGGMLLSGALGNKDHYKNAEIMALATLYSSAITTILKNTVREDRPANGNNKGFPSGHSTTAFAFASVVAAEHPLYFGIPAYAAAAFTGFSRMNENKHYLHDVVGGMTIGVSYGLGIHYLRRAQEANASLPKFQFIALPTDDWSGGMFLTSARF